MEILTDLIPQVQRRYTPEKLRDFVYRELNLQSEDWGPTREREIVQKKQVAQFLMKAYFPYLGLKGIASKFQLKTHGVIKSNIRIVKEQLELETPSSPMTFTNMVTRVNTQLKKTLDGIPSMEAGEIYAWAEVVTQY